MVLYMHCTVKPLVLVGLTMDPMMVEVKMSSNRKDLGTKATYSH